jgi:hypothetical protein
MLCRPGRHRPQLQQGWMPLWRPTRSPRRRASPARRASPTLSCYRAARPSATARHCAGPPRPGRRSWARSGPPPLRPRRQWPSRRARRARAASTGGLLARRMTCPTKMSALRSGREQRRDARRCVTGTACLPTPLLLLALVSVRALSACRVCVAEHGRAACAGGSCRGRSCSSQGRHQAASRDLAQGRWCRGRHCCPRFTRAKGRGAHVAAPGQDLSQGGSAARAVTCIHSVCG